MNSSRHGLLAVVLFGMASLANAGPVRALLGQSATAGAFSSSIVAGDLHTCELIGDGSVRCWGMNFSGQLGNGASSNTPQTTPVQVSGLADAVALAAGSGHTCALRAGGTVSCWGYNNSGQLGDGTTTTRLTPVAVSGLTNAVTLAAGDSHTCALRFDGTVRCWGANGAGRLGDGTTTTRLTLVTVSGLTNAATLAAGSQHTCASLANGTVSCWGGNASGQLGRGTTSASQPQPAAVTGLSDAVAVVAGPFHTCALRADDTVRCWGANLGGELGNGTATSSPTPVIVSGISTAVAIVGSRYSHSCALLSAGTARCWGRNNDGQLGNGTATDFAATPVSVRNLSNAVALAAGAFHTCALQATGGTACWGNNDTGQLGDGSTLSSLVPISSQLVRTISAVGLASGSAQTPTLSTHTCALRADGTVACWGSNFRGALGVETPTTSSSPLAVAGLSGIQALAAGPDHNCALRSDGKVSCWGSNTFGQLGRSTGTFFDPRPALVSGTSSFTALAAGANHTCARDDHGHILCWGRNDLGQVGDGSCCINVPTPVQVLLFANTVDVVAGRDFNCALLADGTASCWGHDDQGQLGDGTPGGVRSIPAAVIGLSNVVAIAAGDSHACALRSDGVVRCWGLNDFGQVGNGIVSSQPAGVPMPAPVAGITNAVAITAGGSTSCALLADGTARCWGDNTSGQVGDGTTTSPRLSPVPVTRLTVFCNAITHQCSEAVLNLGGLIGVSGGFGHICALQVTGAPHCWGSNSSGQVGDGTFVSPRTRALKVSSFQFNIAPAVGLRSPGRVATVTAILNCPDDQQAKVEITLRQGTTVGHGIGMRKCAGGIDRYEFTVPAQGRDSFVAGPAEVQAEAVVLDHGTPVDTQNWTRKVTVSVAP